jgi:hypothetical protein
MGLIYAKARRKETAKAVGSTVNPLGSRATILTQSPA